MALHGRTKIELTDVHTGRVETLEKNNFITNAVAAYNKPLGGLTDAYGLLYGAHITDYYGGLCLFDKALQGDENTFFPQGGAVQVGAAEYGVTNTTADTWLGSYNENESDIDYKNHTATFVYDFTTAQANGNIGAVCLAPAGCGVGGVWGVRGGTAYAMTNLTHSGSNDYAPHDVRINTGTAQYDAATNCVYPVLWDVENDTGYYVNTTVTPYRLEKHKLYLKTASLFYDQSKTNTKVVESWELNFGVSCSIYPTGYDLYDESHFCMYGYTETSAAADAYAGTLYCFVFGLDGALYKTITIQSPCKKTRVADLSMGYLKGYVLLAGKDTEADGTVPVYRVPEANPTDIQPAEADALSENQLRYFKFSLGETYYLRDDGWGTRAAYRVIAYNVVANKIALTNNEIVTLNCYQNYFSYRMKKIPVQHAPFTFLRWCGNPTFAEGTAATQLMRMRAFLSTINNLDEPVTKTADQTMKITYTITEVAGEEGAES